MIRSALALLLSATQMTLPGRGTGGSHSRSLTPTVADDPAVTDRSTAGRAAAQSPISALIVGPGSSSTARSSSTATAIRSAPPRRTVPSLTSRS